MSEISIVINGVDRTKEAFGGATSNLEKLGSVADRVGGVIGGALQFGAIAAGAGFAALGAGILSSIHEAMGAEDAMAGLTAVLKSTHGAAGMTLDALTDLAGKLQESTRYSDEQVESAEKVMLTFTSIGQKVFPDAIKAAADLSSTMGQDLQSSVVQIGKALNDPIEGMTALSRVGVSFDDNQKKQIKTMQEAGNLFGAQSIILKELNKEFGGAAEAAGNTFGGQIDRLKNKFSDIQETIGGAFLPVLHQLADGLLKALSNPALLAGIETTAKNIAQFISNIQTMFQSDGWQGVAKYFWIWLTGSQGVLATAGKMLGDVAATIGREVAKVWPVVEKQLLAWGAQACGWLTNVVTKDIPAKFGEFANRIGTELVHQWPTIAAQLQKWGEQAFDWISQHSIPLINPKFMELVTTVGTFIQQHWPDIEAKLKEWGQKAFDWVKNDALPQLQSKLQPVIDQTKTFLSEKWSEIAPVLAKWGNDIWAWVTTDALPKLGDNLGKMLDGFDKWINSAETQQQIADFSDKIGESIVDFIASFASDDTKVAVGLAPVPNTLLRVINSIAAGIQRAGYIIAEHIVEGILQGMDANREKLSRMLQEFADGMKWAFYHSLGIRSPSTVFAEAGKQLMAGLALGISDNVMMPLSALGGVGAALQGGIGLGAPMIGSRSMGSSISTVNSNNQSAYTLHVHTSAPYEPIVADFNMLKALAS